MTDDEPRRTPPEGYGTVTPWIISRDSSSLIAFLVDAFDGVEIARLVNSDGAVVHAEVRIGDSVVMLFDGRPEWPRTPAFFRLFVEDADAVVASAVAAGATVVSAVTELFWGDRVGRVRDPSGNVWWIQDHVVDLSSSQIEERAADPKFVEAMRYVENALSIEPDDHT